MKKLFRKDKLLLEELQDQYGKETIASAIMAIANANSETATPQECVLDFIMFLEGVRIRMREIHWSAERHSIHKLTDDIIKNTESFEDEIAEDLMGVCGFRIKVGGVCPVMPNSVDLIDVLEEFYIKTIELMQCVGNDNKFVGIKNTLEDMCRYIGQSKYLATMR